MIKKYYPESGYRGNIPKHNESHIWQTYSENHIQLWKAGSISCKNRNKTGVPPSLLLLNIVFEVLAREISQEKEIKRRKYTSLFADYMILFTKNPRDATKKLLEFIK